MLMTSRISKKTSEISHEQVLCTHEDNKVKAFKINTSYFKRRASEIVKRSVDQTFFSDNISAIHSLDMDVTDELLDCLEIPKGILLHVWK